MPGANGKERPIGLVACSYNTNEQAEQLAVHLAAELGLPAIIGPTTSEATTDAFLAIHGSGTLLMTPSSTASSLRELDSDGLLWRTAVDDSYQVEKLLEHAAQAHVKRAVVVFDKYDAYSACSLDYDETEELSGDPQEFELWTVRMEASSFVVDTNKDSGAAQCTSEALTP
jgi:hypothetical protein